MRELGIQLVIGCDDVLEASSRQIESNASNDMSRGLVIDLRTLYRVWLVDVIRYGALSS